MDEAERELVQAWLLKTRSDLDTARQLSQLSDGHPDAAIYHCQHAGEKALKGFLAYHAHPLERTHDLKILVKLASVYDPDFDQWKAEAAILSPYAVMYRYPNETGALEPSREELALALTSAMDLVSFIRARLPPEVQPP